MSNSIFKEVAEADETVRRIRDKPTESELIEDQEDLMDEEDPEEEEEGYRPICHTLDGHSSGSFVFTGLGFGINPRETTLTRFTDRKVRR